MCGGVMWRAVLLVGGVVGVGAGLLAPESALLTPRALSPVLSAVYIEYPGYIHREAVTEARWAGRRPALCHGTLAMFELAACYPSAGQYPPVLDGQPWIGIVSSGGCSLVDKIRHFQRSNASGLIIYEGEKFDYQDLVDLREDHFREFNNPCVVLLGRKAGDSLMKKLLQDGTKIFVDISKDTREFILNRRIAYMLALSFVILMLVMLMKIFHNNMLCVQPVRPPPSPYEVRTKRLKEQFFKSCPVRKIEGNDMEQYRDERCSICLESYKENEEVRILKCRHQYHAECIDPWVLKSWRCALCKRDQSPPDPNAFYMLVEVDEEEETYTSE